MHIFIHCILSCLVISLQWWLVAQPFVFILIPLGSPLTMLFSPCFMRFKTFPRLYLFLNSCRQLLLKRHCLQSSPKGRSCLLPSEDGCVSDQVHHCKINLSLERYNSASVFSCFLNGCWPELQRSPLPERRLQEALATESWLFAKRGLLIGKCDGMKIVSPQ